MRTLLLLQGEVGRGWACPEEELGCPQCCAKGSWLTSSQLEEKTFL